MNIEGKGNVCPKPESIMVPDFVHRSLSQIAEERNSFRGYSTGNTVWKRGLTGNPILKGLLGEWALCTHLRSCGVSPQWEPSLMVCGDDGKDVCAGGYSIQVKTGKNLIRRVDSAKRLLPIVCDIYCFAEIKSDSLVVLNGWIFSDFLSRCRYQKSRFGHYNLEVSDLDLEPISRLCKILK